MKTALILYFSDRGGKTAERISVAIGADYQVEVVRPPHGKLKDVTGSYFERVDAMIFIGSCGIAVRAIAPFIIHKAEDPAVIVCDELGLHVISLLSGHIGGANDLTHRIANAIGADPVITTATDINGRFSADAWATGHNCAIETLGTCKKFSAEILKRDLPLWSEFPINGQLPPGLYQGENGDIGASISIHAGTPFSETLKLIPRIVHIGVGCKRGTDVESVYSSVRESLELAGIHPNSIAGIASIDIKANEDGIIETAERFGVPFMTYTAEELNSLKGDFSKSEFVRGTVGVDCVCERAAVRSAGESSRLLLKKTKYTGVTCAIAIEDWRVSF